MESTSSTIREVVAALYQVLQGVRHVVAQVVEAELVVGAVGDVGAIRDAPLVGRQAGQDDADLQPEEAVYATHPFGVTFGEVVVDGDDVHAVAGQRVEVGRQHAGQGLALTGLHLRDVAEVQCRAAHHLDVEMPLVQYPPGGLTRDCEGLGQQIIETGAVGDPLLEFVRLGPQLGVGELLHVVGQGVDVLGHPLEALDHAAFAKTEQLIQHAIPQAFQMGWI